MEIVEEFSFTNRRDLKLHAVAVLPAGAGDIRAALVFQHGYAEHSGRKLPAFKQLATAGVAVYALDVAGFGRSEPLEAAGRALIQDYQHLVDDLCRFGEAARERHQAQGLPQVPWFLGGFSLGGLTAAHAAARAAEDGVEWAGLVLVGGCFGVNMSLKTRLQQMIAPILNAAVPNAEIVDKLEPLKLNPDPEHVADYEADELVYRRNTRVSMAFQMGQMMKAVPAVCSQLQLPIFAVHADNDLITPYKALTAFLDAAPSSDKQLKTIQGGFHDILSGKDAAQHVAEIAQWLLQHVQ